jgi:biopolymer transport protein ExbD
MKLHIKKERNADIPTASMADIAFLLIIFFMLTGIFALTKGPSFAPPQKEETLEVKPEESIYIYISADGSISVDKHAVNFIQLKEYILSKLSQNPDKPIIIDTNPNCAYGKMVEVFDTLKQIKAKNISIPTKTDRQYWALFGFNYNSQE